MSTAPGQLPSHPACRESIDLRAVTLGVERRGSSPGRPVGDSMFARRVRAWLSRMAFRWSSASPALAVTRDCGVITAAQEELRHIPGDVFMVPVGLQSLTSMDDAGYASLQVRGPWRVPGPRLTRPP